MQQWLKDAHKKLDSMPEEAKELKELAESNLWTFARLVNPSYVYGSVHKEIYDWMQDYSLYGKGDDEGNNKLVMLPRAHLKSHMVATWCAWMIVRHPEITILYLSATAELAITQLYDIKNILESYQFQKYWPDYIKPDRGMREKWSEKKIIIDHPQRKKEAVRDATIATAGLTTNTTGWHADIIVSDDLVVPENAYTEEGRDSVKKKTSQFTSIRNAGGFTMACGTRYHPVDIYHTFKNQMYEDYDEEGTELGKKHVWQIKEYQVEVEGIFIWPRAIRPDGKAFGFDKRVLARIEGEYEDNVQFFAQYYNNPNDPTSNRLDRTKFQYYNPRFLRKENGKWNYNGHKLNIFAAVDFAFSLERKADWTAIVVVGVDSESNYYVLDIDRFKADKTYEYYKHIAALHSKWSFKKINCEITVAQKVIVQDIKEHVKKHGSRIAVEEYRPTRQEGRKEERIAAALEPLYDDLRVWHHEGGWTPVLEDELILARPPNDDIKDALASAVTIAVKPARSLGNAVKDFMQPNRSSNRFGGTF